MIKINKLNKSYDKPIYNNFAYTFGQGSYQIVGPNGSGKSTLFEVITNKTTYEGNVEIMGEDNLNTNEILTKYITYITQEDNFINGKTAKQNIDIFYQDYNHHSLNELISYFDFEALLETKVQQLSGGERKKLQLIIGLAFNRPIIILDEADNHLDDQSLNQLSSFFNQHEGTILFTSHTNFLDNVIELDITTDNNEIFAENNVNTSQAINFSYEYNMKNKNLHKKLYIYIFLLISFISIMLLGFVAFSSYYKFDAFHTIDFPMFASDEAIIIEPPVKNEYRTVFATKDWFEKTPFYLTEEFVNKVKASKHVNDVKFLPDINITTSVIYDGGIEYSTQHNDFWVSTSIVPNEIAEKTNLNGVLNDDITGDLPKDDAFEIVVPVSYMEENNLNIGDEIEINGTPDDGSVDKIFPFKIVGINNGISDDFVISYQSESEFVNEQNLNNNIEFLERSKDFIQANTIGFTENDIKEDENYYLGIFVETKSKKDTIELIKEIQNYDPYMSILSNFGGQTSILNQYTNLKSKDIMIKLAIFNFVVLIILVSLFRYLDYKHFKNYYLHKLSNYGYSPTLINKIANNINKKYNYILLTYGIITFLLFIIFKLQFILFTFVIAIFYIIVSALIGSVIKKQILNLKELNGNSNQ